MARATHATCRRARNQGPGQSRTRCGGDPSFDGRVPFGGEDVLDPRARSARSVHRPRALHLPQPGIPGVDPRTGDRCDGVLPEVVWALTAAVRAGQHRREPTAGFALGASRSLPMVGAYRGCLGLERRQVRCREAMRRSGPTRWRSRGSAGDAPAVASVPTFPSKPVKRSSRSLMMPLSGSCLRSSPSNLRPAAYEIACGNGHGRVRAGAASGSGPPHCRARHTIPMPVSRTVLVIGNGSPMFPEPPCLGP